jgi:hypothetical protein
MNLAMSQPHASMLFFPTTNFRSALGFPSLRLGAYLMPLQFLPISLIHSLAPALPCQGSALTTLQLPHITISIRLQREILVRSCRLHSFSSRIRYTNQEIAIPAEA